MSEQTSNLSLPYIMAAQAQKHVTHNEALRALDAMVQISIKDQTLSTPPSAPVEGDRFIIASSATGAWAGQEGSVAAFQDGVWEFYEPIEGWVAWMSDDSALFVFDGTQWVDSSGVGGGVTKDQMKDGYVKKMGVNAPADDTNRLSVNSNAVLLNHNGDNMQMKINKNTSGDTASLIFQTNFSGRAEFGTTGDDDFHVKVSPDGATFHESLVIDKGTGNIDFKGQTTVSANTVWHAGNDGSGSGLDADLLDGQHASEFVRKLPEAAGLDSPRMFLGAKTSINYDISGTLRKIRYNIEINDLSAGQSGMYCMEVTGYSLRSSNKVIKLIYTGYKYGSPASLIHLDGADLTGLSRTMGAYISSNNKLTLFFEVHNYYTTFIVEAVRVGNGDAIGPGGINVLFTESGVQV